MIFSENDSVEVNNQRNKGHLLTSYILHITHVLSCFSHVQLFATLWTIARQAPLFKGFSRQEYWSGLPFPSPGDPALAGRFSTVEPPGKAQL